MHLLLTTVNLLGNSLTGTTPTTFAVVHLDLSEILLAGKVPPQLDQMNSSKELSPEYNWFTESKRGSICDFLAGLDLSESSGDCEKLECPCGTSS